MQSEAANAHNVAAALLLFSPSPSRGCASSSRGYSNPSVPRPWSVHHSLCRLDNTQNTEIPVANHPFPSPRQNPNGTISISAPPAAAAAAAARNSSPIALSIKTQSQSCASSPTKTSMRRLVLAPVTKSAVWRWRRRRECWSSGWRGRRARRLLMEGRKIVFVMDCSIAW